MDLLNETGFLKTKSTLFNLLIRETSQFLCYKRLLNTTYMAYKNAFFREMQFWSHCYTVVSYQALFRLSVYKVPAVYLSGAKNVCFCTIRDFGSPTICLSHFRLIMYPVSQHQHLCILPPGHMVDTFFRLLQDMGTQVKVNHSITGKVRPLLLVATRIKDTPNHNCTNPHL